MNSPDTDINQRSAPRVSASSNVWIHCRLATGGPDLANGLLDISAGGIQFLAKALLQRGDAVDVVLITSTSARAIGRRAEVSWAVPLGSDACCAGVRFLEPLSAEELRVTTSEPNAASEPALGLDFLA
jgi:c-di-GMP-binding flagellar brake protein YcgR